MEDLLKAIQIFLKYGNPVNPTHCEHDVMRVNINSEIVSEEDLKELNKLGFFPDDEFEDTFKSYKFGRC